MIGPRKHGLAQRLEHWLGVAASVILAALMFGTFADVLARYLFNFPLRGAFEMTELGLLVLIFAGLPLVSLADEHVTMDFIDRWLPAALGRLLRRAVQFFCGAVWLGLAWLTWLKAGKIAGYGDTTDVLKVPVGPFVYLMTAMIAIAGLIHLARAITGGERAEAGFDPQKSSTT